MIFDLLQVEVDGHEGYTFVEEAALAASPKAVLLVHASSTSVQDVILRTAMLGGNSWTVVLLSDEERKFDALALLETTDHNVVIQSPKPRDLQLFFDFMPRVMFAPFGYTLPFRQAVMGPWTPPVLRLPGFAGQVTHRRREEWVDALKRIGAEMYGTDGFMKGMAPQTYKEWMNELAVLPAPSGPNCPDTFRMWEALQLGRTPVQDYYSYDQDPNFRWFWDAVGIHLPWGAPGTYGPEALARLTASAVNDGVRGAAISQSRYSMWKRQWRREFDELVGVDFFDLSSEITVVVSTSPVPGDGYAMLVETLESVRRQLPESEILIFADGVRDEQAHLAEGYYESLTRLACDHSPGRGGLDVSLCFDGTWRHQAGTARRWMDEIRSTYVLFVEHDAPFVRREIDWEDVKRHAAHLMAVRFHFMPQVHPEHEYLTVEDREMVTITRQWSQRPHLMRTNALCSALATHFTEESRTMIEDKLHSVAQREHWEIGIWSPVKADLKYTDHLDGRGDEPKFGMKF